MRKFSILPVKAEQAYSLASSFLGFYLFLIDSKFSN